MVVTTEGSCLSWACIGYNKCYELRIRGAALISHFGAVVRVINIDSFWLWVANESGICYSSNRCSRWNISLSQLGRSYWVESPIQCTNPRAWELKRSWLCSGMRCADMANLNGRLSASGEDIDEDAGYCWRMFVRINGEDDHGLGGTAWRRSS